MEIAQKQIITGRIKHTLKWIGVFVSFASIIFFASMIYKYLSVEDISAFVFENWQNVVFSFILYAIAWVPLSAGWLLISNDCGIKASIPVRLNILYLSQAAKYLPGNIGQYIGRLYLAKTSGFSIKSTTIAMAIELAAILIACAVLTSVLFFINFNTDVVLTGIWFYDLAIKYTGLVTVVIAFVLCVGIMHLHKELIVDHIYRFGIAVLYMMLTICGYALSNVVLLIEFIPEPDFTLLIAMFSAVVISWFVGFITPGAPAGIGVREVIFFALLNGTIDESSLLLAMLVFRLVTVAGDLMIFVVGLTLRVQSSNA